MLKLAIHDLLKAFEALLVLLDGLIGALLAEYFFLSARTQLYINPNWVELEFFFEGNGKI